MKFLLRRKTLKGTGISISEDLTKNNVLLMNGIRADNRVESTWSHNGNIYCKVKNSTRKIHVNLFDTLSEILAKYNL